MVRSTATTFMLLVSASSYITTLVSAGGMIAQVVDSTNFCVMLPPPGEMSAPLSDNEWDSQAYCLGDTPKAIDANTLPDGFIQSAHYVATDEYVQVTGQFDPTKIGLNPADDGGQTDIMAPKGSSCAGWKYYVNLIEPSGNTYCMRCCNDTKNCNRGISEKGCAHIIPGDYSGPMNGSGGGMPTSSPASSPTHTTEKPTTATHDAGSTSSPDSDSSPTTTSSSDGSASTSAPDSGSGSGSETHASSSSSESLPSPSPQVPSSSSLPSTGASSSLPNSASANSNASGSQSGDLAQSSVSAQSKSQASTLTSPSIVTGGLVALIAMVVSA